MNTQQDQPAPPSEARPDAEGAHQAALLIDFDNVTMGIRSNLGQELRNLLNSDVIRGKVAVQRAYADWRRYPQYIVPLSEASVDLIFAPAYGSSKKNATDIRLAIDGLELVFTRPEIKTFILMSGDSDFSSLVLKLKEYGKYVIGVGIQESSSDLLVQNCDEYYSYSALSGLIKAGDEQRERHDPWVLVAKAIEKMVERGDTMRSDRLKQVMLEIDPTFNDKELGFSRFNRFVVEAASQGLLSIQKMENGQYAVLPGAKSRAVAGGEAAEPEATEVGVDGPRAKTEKKEPKAEGRRAGGRRGKGRTTERKESQGPKSERGETRRARPRLTLELGLELLDKALRGLLDGPDESVRDSDVKRRLLELDPDFDEGELGFSKFSKFLQQASDSGAIELKRGANGNFLVSRPGRPRKGKRGGRKTKARSRESEAPAAPGSKEERREPAMKRLARFFLGGDGEEEAPGPAATGPETAAGPDAVPPGAGEGAGSATARRAKKEDQRRSRAGRDRRKPARERRGASGRSSRRSGRKDEAVSRTAAENVPSSSSSPTSPTSPARTTREERPAPGPGETPAGEAVAEQTAKRETSVAPVTPAPLPGAPRGTIRGRWGTRGRYRPGTAPPPLLKGQTESGTIRTASEEVGDMEAPAMPPSAPAAGERPQDPAEFVSYLSTRYAGVGKKTAEMLVDAFGSDLFRILDEEPERVRQVLPDHRAERVIAAHRQGPSPGGR